MSAGAAHLANKLTGHPKLRDVRYPGHPSHPQFDLARRQMKSGGTILTLTVAAPVDRAKETAFSVMDALVLCDISNNVGDSKSLVTHPATTTHRRLSPEARALVGITDGMIRLSVGLEDPDDLLADVEQALDRVASAP
jgi:O-succinylhomoserine sulfhydrylase